jgi:hypothetical protein
LNPRVVFRSVDVDGTTGPRLRDASAPLERIGPLKNAIRVVSLDHVGSSMACVPPLVLVLFLGSTALIVVRILTRLGW